MFRKLKEMKIWFHKNLIWRTGSTGNTRAVYCLCMMLPLSVLCPYIFTFSSLSLKCIKFR